MPNPNHFDTSALCRPQERPPHPLSQRRPSTQQQEGFSNYTPHEPDLQVTAAAAGLNLARAKTTGRTHQRPWTLKEWAFVERIPEDIDGEGMKKVMFK
jgi:hypothetical protein